MQMKKRVQIIAFLVLSYFNLFSCGGGNEARPGPPANDLTDIPALMEFYKVPGVSIAIIKDFSVDQLLVYGVKDQNTKRLVTNQTLFQSASISKSVTAMAALKFAQDGEIDLDEDINNKLTSWKVPENRFITEQKVTLRRLLSHTAGTTVSGFDGYSSTEAIPSLSQILNGEPPANSAPIVVDTTPGGESRYSGGGYIIIEQVLEDIAQKTFPQLMSETVFEPLALSNSTFEQPLPQENTPNASAGHDSDGNVVPGNYNIYPEMAAAGLWTTPKDLALFLIELQLSLQGQSNKVINQQMTEEMMIPVREKGYGLGLGMWRMGDEVYFGHDGVNHGFVSSMQAHKNSGVGIVVMTNSDNGMALIERVIQIIGKQENWPGY